VQVVEKARRKTAMLPTVAFCGDILAHSFDSLARNDFPLCRRLNGNVVQLASDHLLEPGHEELALFVRARRVDEGGQGVDLVSVEPDRELHDVGWLVPVVFVVERSVPANEREKLCKGLETVHNQSVRMLV
jgi:hypothetical protein